MIFISGKAINSLDMRWKRLTSAATADVASQSASIPTVLYGISVSKPAAALALQFLQAEKQKPLNKR